MTNLDFKQIIPDIVELLGSNSYSEVLAKYLGVARQDKAPPDLIRLVAQAAFCLEQFQVARGLLLEASKRHPDNSSLWHDAGFCLLKLQELPEAESAIRLSLHFRPKNPASLLILGNILKASLKFTEAIQTFQEVLELQPDNSAAMNNLATTLVRIGSYLEAKKIYQTLLASGNQSANSEFNYANLLSIEGRYEEAIIHYERAIDLDPKLLAALNNVGHALQTLGRLSEAELYFEKALACSPDNAEIKLNKGKLLQLRGDWKNASALFREISENTSKITVSARCNLCYLLNFSDEISAEELFDEHKKLYQQLSIEGTYAPTRKSKGELLRVGYLSPDFRTHSVAYFLENILSSHSKDKFHITLYANQTLSDNVTERFKIYSDSWQDVKHFSDLELLNKIRSDDIDILIDLAGLTAGSRPQMLAQRAARIQINYLGYPHSSGIPNMDYRIVDSITDPLRQPELASETLVRLDPCFISYQPQKVSMHRSESDSQASLVFGCFNAIAKLSDTLIEMWSKILKSVPNSKLLLKSQGLGDEKARKRIIERFASFEIASPRLLLQGFINSQEQHLSLYNQVDLALDTFPYCGTTTSCEALSMAVPVLTLCGDRHASRVGASILSAVGLEELITHSAEEYVTKAVTLAGDPLKLAGMREFLGASFRTSTLCNSQLFIKRWEEMLLGMA